MVLRNYVMNFSELINLYDISFSDNKPINNMRSYNLVNNLHDILTHCKWLSMAVFNGYNPSYINQQIIQVDGRQWIHHKKICYCPNGGDYNCTIDLLGPVYPGQMLQAGLCMPLASKNYTVYVETHASSLPSSTCKIAHQSELIKIIGNFSRTYNFTIVSEVESCELFLMVENYFQSAFYV